MKDDKKRRQSINRVRRKAEDEDLILTGRSAIPDDTRKTIRKRGSQLEIHHNSRVTGLPEEDIKKGRRPAQPKTKTKADRHAPRKTEIEKEYTKEARKLRARLRYREKQGFYVKWETLPSRPSRVTQQSIEKIKSYYITLNKNNEIELKRFKYKEGAREMPPKLRIKYTDSPNYDINNDPHFIPPAESVQNFDVYDRIIETLMYDISMVQNEGTQLDHPLQDDIWIELSDSVERAYREALDYVKSKRDSPQRQKYADYLVAHEPEITEAIDAVLRVSTQDQIDQARTEMLRYLEYH